MTDDYHDAFRRHKQDAEILLENGRYANADHLYGVAAECGIKALLVAKGVFSPSQQNDKHRKHIPDLFKYVSHFDHLVSNFTTLSFVPIEEKFKGWEIAQRYHHEKHFDEHTAELRQEGAKMVNEILKEAKRAGILT